MHGAYLYQVLGPALRPGDVVVLDNQTVHKVAGLGEIAAAQGLPDLPPCSPDLNPIEHRLQQTQDLVTHGPSSHLRTA